MVRKTSAVCNVKGGTGKTLVSINLAHKLKDMGNKVGLIDCDLDNSNFATFTGTQTSINIDSQKHIEPYDWDGIQVFSMSLLAGKEKAVSMTGDRYMAIINDAIQQGKWDSDIFVLDLPAGSGDIFRICMELFAETLIGNVIVVQPSLLDATKRILNIHKYLEIPMLGVIENMSYFACREHDSPKVYYPFGKNDIEGVCAKYSVPFLGRIPLSEDIATGVAKGKPFLMGEGLQPIVKASKLVMERDVPKTSYMERFKEKITSLISVQVQRVFAALIMSAKKDFNIKSVKETKGFTEDRPIRISVTDDSGRKEILSVDLKVENDGIKLLKNPKQVDFEVVGSFRTLARMIMGKKKVGDHFEVFNPEDAWLMNDVKVYGEGYTPRAFQVFRNLFGDPSLMADVRDKYGKVLDRWV